MGDQTDGSQVTRYETALAVFIKIASMDQLLLFDRACLARRADEACPLAYGVVREVSEEHAVTLRDTIEVGLSEGNADRVRSMDKDGTLPADIAAAFDRGCVLTIGLSLLRALREPGSMPLMPREAPMADFVRSVAEMRRSDPPAAVVELLDRRRWTLGHVLDIATVADRAAEELIRLNAVQAAGSLGDA